MTVIDNAIHFVTDAMSGRVRKVSGTPAVFHALEAGIIASSLTNDSEIIAAALLHDVIEDCGVTEETVRISFGERVTELVLGETEDKRIGVPPDKTWRVRKEEAIAKLQSTQDEGIKILFLSDKLSNMRSIAAGKKAQGAELWQSFNQKDPKEHEWYYRSVADALYGLQDTPAWKEYDRLIKSTFNEGE